MPPPSTRRKDDTITFRLDAASKAELTRAAAEDEVAPAELLRTLVRDHLAERGRRAFESEARRQSLAIARRARDPDSDEARVLRELEAAFDRDEFGPEWTG